MVLPEITHKAAQTSGGRSGALLVAPLLRYIENSYKPTASYLIIANDCYWSVDNCLIVGGPASSTNSQLLTKHYPLRTDILHHHEPTEWRIIKHWLGPRIHEQQLVEQEHACSIDDVGFNIGFYGHVTDTGAVAAC